MSMTKPPAHGNPTMTVELTDEGTTVIGVFRKGKIDRGGALTKIPGRAGAHPMWRGQTARRNDRGMEPVYQGPSRADGLLRTLFELDHELRSRSTAEAKSTGAASGDPAPPTEAHRVSLLADNNGTRWPPAFNEALDNASAARMGLEAGAPPTTRYEWPDGSAIVTTEGGWDLGIHRDRLAEAAARYTPPDEIHDSLDMLRTEQARFAWVGAGYGLDPSDALPPRKS